MSLFPRSDPPAGLLSELPPAYGGSNMRRGARTEAAIRQTERPAEQIIGAQKRNIKFTAVQAP
jgi:hypothetical protein